MPKSREKPTSALYESLQAAYQHFNQTLFQSRLPEVLFTVQRQAGTLGYFIPDRWTSPSGDLCHEIAINPTHMGTSRVLDVLQTLVHEMAHCWQHCFGKPASKGYHNKEWAYKMIELGLYPSTTGEPGGEITGMLMSDYVVEGGAFWHASVSLIQQHEFQLPWICRLTVSKESTEEKPTTISLPAPEGGKPLKYPETTELGESTTPESLLFSAYSNLLPEDTFHAPPPRGKLKSKYHCSGCGLNAWAKPNVRLLCIECDLALTEQ